MNRANEFRTRAACPIAGGTLGVAMLVGASWPLSSPAQDATIRLEPGPLVVAVERLADALSRTMVLGHGVEGVLRAPMEGESAAVLDALATRFELSIHDDGTSLFVDSADRELVRFVALVPDAMRRVRIALEGVPPVDDLRVHLVEAGVLLSGDRRHVDALERALQIEARRAVGETVVGEPETSTAIAEEGPPSTPAGEISATADSRSMTAPEASTPSSAPTEAPSPSSTLPTSTDRPDPPPDASDETLAEPEDRTPAPRPSVPHTPVEPPRDIESIPGFGDELPR